jgi:K(+)-stimulated pyrophosphate-energized sodium pump
MKMSRAVGAAPRNLLWNGLLALAGVVATLAAPARAFASELDLEIPALDTTYTLFGSQVSGVTLLLLGLGVCVLGMLFGLAMFNQVKGMPAHKSMLDVSSIIYETCKAYLLQQGRLLVVLEVFIGACIVYYFGVLEHMGAAKVALILMWSVVGILGSYSVAWFGIRMNTYANSRTAFASLRGKPLPVYEIPLQAGMSIGVLLICVELIMMLVILLFVPKEAAGASFLGFAIGESLGASALRIAGGIFTKIADIGSDLMKVVFKIKEDDPRNPGVIADCTGDNAGDSVGPTADGFETYGVTGVALISFIALAVMPEHKAHLLVWIFVMRILMIGTSIIAFSVNGAIARSQNQGKDKINFEDPLTSLVWMTSVLSIIVTYGVSYWMLADLGAGLWWKLSTIISCGTLAAALIPEFTKVFTSSHSRHTKEIVAASREGGASLTILSGMVAGNFSVFWKALTLAVMLLIAYVISLQGLAGFMNHAAVFAFGLVAFGLLGMGPVTIAVDSYGPVTDNAQSIFELSQVESTPGTSAEIEKQFGFKPDFAKGKHYLEDNDGAGNTFKATAKPVLIATAVAISTGLAVALKVLPAPSFSSSRCLPLAKSGRKPNCFSTSPAALGIDSICDSSKMLCALSVTGP